MTVTTTPHLNFRGEAREALAFYARALGGEMILATYRDAGVPVAPEALNQIIWGQVAAPGGARVMAYDVPAHMAHEPGANAFFVSLRGTEAAEVEALWAGLSEGAEVVHPLGPSGWSPLYGMLRDRFGVTWVLDLVA
jgi:PhnB protein